MTKNIYLKNYKFYNTWISSKTNSEDIMNKINYFLDYFKYLKNPIPSLMFKFGLKNECEIKLKNSNEKVKLTSIPALNKLMIMLKNTKITKYPQLVKYIENINDNNEIMIIDDINYINIYNTNFIKKHPKNYANNLEEFFSDDSWDMLDINNRYIIDIGANVADTPLFFAKNGSKVIGFEPVKHLYDLGKKNIQLNPKLEKKIQFINKAVGGKRGTLKIGTTSTQGYVDKNESYEVEVITIQNVLNDYNFPPDILKMDCEGCEFEIILNEDLTMFNEIVFEHHSKIAGKDYKPLIDKLKKDGFKIDTYEVSASKLPFEDIGIIHAYK